MAKPFQILIDAMPPEARERSEAKTKATLEEMRRQELQDVGNVGLSTQKPKKRKASS